MNGTCEMANVGHVPGDWLDIEIILVKYYEQDAGEMS